jgi:ATP-dependent DNA helicase RecG
MREVDKVLDHIEDCIVNNYYESVETEVVELKPTPPNLIGAKSVLQSICAFMNTNGGILILGIKDNNNVVPKNYEIKGYNEDTENLIKSFGKQFTDKDGQQVDVSEYIVDFKVKDFLNNKICVVYIDKLPDDQKYVFFNRKAYKRILTGDHEIDENTIARHEEFKEEIRNARELTIEKEATLADIDLGKLSDYIYLLNREVMTESPKNDIDNARSFLTRKKFIIGDNVTTLGLLVCGKNVKDFLGWRSQVDGFVDIPFDVAQDKKQLVDNVIPLMERSLAYILKNIQVGVTVNKSGTSKPEYPEKLLRETINNAIAHRDYSINKYININIKPDTHIEIRNPGSFKKQLLIDIIDHEIPVRRIIPDSKPRNPKLADVLKVFDKWEGASRGMSNLVNETLANKIDLPYYRFYNENDLGLFIPKGKLVDDAFIALLNSFDLFIETRLNGSQLKAEEIAVLAYFYKSEKANTLYRHTILLSPDNNHFEAIGRLEKSGLIIKHSENVKSHDMPIFVLNRVLMREEYIDELRKIFGGRFDELSEINKQVLSLIYQFNHYNKNRTISATQAGRLLFDRTEEMANSSAFDNFKRKIYTVFKKLVASDFLKEQDKRGYFINENFKRIPSIFDKND